MNHVQNYILNKGVLKMFKKRIKKCVSLLMAISSLFVSVGNFKIFAEKESLYRTSKRSIENALSGMDLDEAHSLSKIYAIASKLRKELRVVPDRTVSEERDLRKIFREDIVKTYMSSSCSKREILHRLINDFYAGGIESYPLVVRTDRGCVIRAVIIVFRGKKYVVDFGEEVGEFRFKFFTLTQYIKVIEDLFGKVTRAVCISTPLNICVNDYSMKILQGDFDLRLEREMEKSWKNIFKIPLTFRQKMICKRYLPDKDYRTDIFFKLIGLNYRTYEVVDDRELISLEEFEEKYLNKVQPFDGGLFMLMSIGKRLSMEDAVKFLQKNISQLINCYCIGF